jgi:hypothetical protein
MQNEARHKSLVLSQRIVSKERDAARKLEREIVRFMFYSLVTEKV